MAQAAAALAAAPGRAAYARVDGIVRDGLFVLMELEYWDTSASAIRSTTMSP